MHGMNGLLRSLKKDLHTYKWKNKKMSMSKEKS